MPVVRLPLSGDVSQSILPWTWMFNPVRSQIGLVNIELGQSSSPVVEQAVLTEVASYGRQLGRIGDALAVLLDHFHPERPLTAPEKKAVAALRSLLADIDDVKKAHGRG